MIDPLIREFYPAPKSYNPEQIKRYWEWYYAERRDRFSSSDGGYEAELKTKRKIGWPPMVCLDDIWLCYCSVCGAMRDNRVVVESEF